MTKIDPWHDVRDHLTDATAALFPLPEFAQAAANPYSMSNFESLLAPLIDSLEPKHFCEIGSDKGLNTQFMVSYCRAHEGQLTIVDPLADEDGEITKFPFVTHQAVLSLDYLKEPNDVDIYYIDGDHNYETVIQELRLIDRHRRPDKPICLFVHDTSWPCARRDFYYAPDTVSSPHEYRGLGHHLSPYSEQLVEAEGYEEGRGAMVALREATEKNGVLTAVEDFMAEGQEKGWHRMSIPSLFGLTILWHRPSLSPEQDRVFEETAERMRTFIPFLNILELNRIILLELAYDAGITWKRQRAYIENLDEENAKLRRWLWPFLVAPRIAKAGMAYLRRRGEKPSEPDAKT